MDRLRPRNVVYRYLWHRWVPTALPKEVSTCGQDRLPHNPLAEDVPEDDGRPEYIGHDTRRCNTALMNISEWWPLVDAETRG